MRINLVAKLLIPLGICFTAITYFMTSALLDLYAKELIANTKSSSLSIASQAAMQFDAGTDPDILKRIVTIIALNDNVTRSTILSPQNDEVVASSQYRYAKTNLDILPDSMLDAYLSTKFSNNYSFTDVVNSQFSLAYPVTTIANNNQEILNFVLVLNFDTFKIEEQYNSYETETVIIAAAFLAMICLLSYLLIGFLVRRPLNVIESTIKQQALDHSYENIQLNTRDEFEDIVNEFNRLRSIEKISLIGAKKAREAAEELATKKSQFLANVSHELRTPLNGLLGLAQLSLNAKSDQDRNRYLQQMNSTSHLVLSVVNDILDFSKLTEQGIELQKSDCPVSSILFDVGSLIQVLSDRKAIDFIINIGAKLPYSIEIDQLRVQQVLINILNNAVKFTNQGSIKLSVDFNELGDSFGEISMSVKDTGIGISQDKLHILFDPFEQADSSISRKYGGTGLGLSITKQLLELMGGSISVNSKLGVGSEFLVTIPCRFTSIKEHCEETLAQAKLPMIEHEQIESERIKYIVDEINQFADETIDKITLCQNNTTKTCK